LPRDSRWCFFRRSRLAPLSSLVTWCSSADFLFVGLPLYIDSRGFFTRFCPRFSDFVFVGLPLYIDSRGFFTRFCPRFADFVYVGSPLYIDMALYIDTFGGLCVCG
jgi:hypothetical protein